MVNLFDPLKRPTSPIYILAAVQNRLWANTRECCSKTREERWRIYTWTHIFPTTCTRALCSRKYWTRVFSIENSIVFHAHASRCTSPTLARHHLKGRPLLSPLCPCLFIRPTPLYPREAKLNTIKTRVFYIFIIKLFNRFFCFISFHVNNKYIYRHREIFLVRIQNRVFYTHDLWQKNNLCFCILFFFFFLTQDLSKAITTTITTTTSVGFTRRLKSKQRR